MELKRVKYPLLAVIVLITFVLISCAPSPVAKLSSTSTPPAAALGICAELTTSELFDLQAASVMQILLEGTELGPRGESGANQLVQEYLSPADTFCGLEVSPDLKKALDEVQSLIDSGQTGEANQKLDDLLQAVEEDQFSAVRAHKKAAPAVQAGALRVRAKVRNYLAIAARADYWGNDGKFETAMDSARGTYQSWASDVIDSASIKEALRIAAEASLLGLDDLSEDAVDRARDLVEADLIKELDRYQPCSATREDTGRLLDAAARVELLSLDAAEYGFMSEVNEWLEIQELRKAGKAVPQCDQWQVDLVLDNVWDRGNYLITWEGKFKVLEDGTLEGQGQGTHTTHVEVNCVDVMTGEEFMSTTDAGGSFTFQIQGNLEDGEFRFLFPAEVEVSGVDTCNEFDGSTYLPASVIQEINVYGGAENYDPELDTIYMVLPAENGASQQYETILGPLELTVSYLGDGAE